VAINPVVAEHLGEARRELVRQRDALERDIAQLDALLGAGQPKPRRQPRPVGEQASLRTAPALREAILALLEGEERNFSTREIAEKLSADFGWQTSSIRSQVAKMAKANEIFLVRRGVYRATTPNFIWSGSKNPSGPAEAGPEVQVPTTSTGGDPHAQIDQGHGHTSQGTYRDDRGGAPVGGSTY